MTGSLSADQFRSIADRYLEELRVRCGDGHVANVRRSLDSIVEICSDLSVSSLLAFRAARAAEASNRSANMDVGAARAALKWATEMGLIAENPIGRVRYLPQRPDDLKKRRRSLMVHEAERFMAAVVRQDVRRALMAKPAGRQPAKQEPLWRTILEAGLRWKEACMLELSDIYDDAIVVRSKTAKSRRERTIPVRRGLVDMIRQWVPFRAPQGGLWRSKDRSNARVAFLGILGHAAGRSIGKKSVRDGRVLRGPVD